MYIEFLPPLPKKCLYIQGSYRVHTGFIQGSYRSVYTYRVHTGFIQGSYRVHIEVSIHTGFIKDFELGESFDDHIHGTDTGTSDLNPLTPFLYPSHLYYSPLNKLCSFR